MGDGFDAMPLAERPDLTASARKSGMWLLGGGGAALLGALMLLIIGLAGPCFIVVAAGLGLLGVVAIPYGAMLLVDPLRDVSIRALGPDDRARRAALDAIEEELMTGCHLRITRGETLSLTERWVVIHGGLQFRLFRHRDVLWVHAGKQKDGKFKLYIVPRDRGGLDLHVQEPQIPHLLDAFAAFAPAAFIGYTPELARLSEGQLAAAVDRRAAALRARG